MSSKHPQLGGTNDIRVLPAFTILGHVIRTYMKIVNVTLYNLSLVGDHNIFFLMGWWVFLMGRAAGIIRQQ